MIPASGAGGHEFDSRIAPLSFFDNGFVHFEEAKPTIEGVV
jgi:hypothetical protein